MTTYDGHEAPGDQPGASPVDGGVDDEDGMVAGPADARSGRRLAAILFDMWGLPPLFALLWSWLPSPLNGIVALVSWLGTLIALESTLGATPGKLLAGLRVRGADGSFPSIRSATVRRSWIVATYLAAAAGGIVGLPLLGMLAVPVIIGSLVWTVSNDPDGRGWHDRLAATTVMVERMVARPAVLLAAIVLLGVPYVVQIALTSG